MVNTNFIYILESKDSDCGWLPVSYDQRNSLGEYEVAVFKTEEEAANYQKQNHFGLCNYRITKVKKKQ